MNMEQPSTTPDADPRKRIDAEMKEPKEETTPPRYTYDPKAFGPEGEKIAQTVMQGEWKEEGVRKATEEMKKTDAIETDIRYGKKE